jgi:biotin-(acetyl-CoA carboxylase) ligase
LLVEIINEFSSNFHLLIDGKFDQIYGLWRNSSKLIGKTVEFRGEGDYYKSAKIIDLMENGSIKLLVDETEKIYNNGEIKLKL